MFDGPANVAWFGARGDGVTDDTLAIQSAIDAHASVVFGPGQFRITAPLRISRAGSYRGAGPHATRLALEQTGVIEVKPATPSGIVSEVTLGDFSIIAAAGERPGQAAIRCEKLFNSTLEALIIKQHGIGLELVTTTVVTVNNISILEMAAGAVGLRVNGGRDHFIDDIAIEQDAALGSGLVGIDVPFTAATWISNVDVVNYATGVRFSPDASNGHVDWCFLSHVATDQCGTTGFLFDAGGNMPPGETTRIKGVSLVNCWAGSSGVGLIMRKRAAGDVLDGIDILGCKILNNQNEGIRIESSYDASPAAHRIANVKVADSKIAGNSQAAPFTKPGVYVGSGTRQVQLCGNHIGVWGDFDVTQNYAIWLAASPPDGTDNLIINDNMLIGAAGAVLKDEAAGGTKSVGGNIGFQSQFAGQVMAPHGETSWTGPHGRSRRPCAVAISPLDNLHGYEPPIVSAVTETDFTVTLSTPAFGNKWFYFSARVYPQ